MTAEERAQILVTGRLLEAVGRVDLLSSGLTLLSGALLVFRDAHRTAAVAAIVLGLIAKLYFVRIAFDARLLNDVATGSLTTPDLDGALGALGLVPRGKAGREWSARCRGAKRLAFAGVASTIAQCLILALQ